MLFKINSLKLSIVVLNLSFFQSAAFSQTSSDQISQVSKDYVTYLHAYSLEDIRGSIGKIWTHGLNPSVYWTPEMERKYQSKVGTQSLKEMAVQNFLNLLMDLSIGGVNPEEVSEDIKLLRKSFLKPKHFKAIVVTTGQQPELLIESLAPKNAPYVALRAGIRRLYPACNNGSFAPLQESKKTLRLGVRDTSVIATKKRFAFLGYKISSMDDVVDADMVAAINDIEWNLHIKPDASMSPGGKVWAFLNVSCSDRLRQMQADMEKMRWFPQRFEDKFIFLNLAMNYFALFDLPNKYVMSFRTINGRAERKTPTMHDHLKQIILNPSWVVPPTIFIEDKVKEIQSLGKSEIREYFESRNYEVWNLDLTERIDPETIDWWNINSTSDSSFYIRQKPHYMNALGVAKFDLTNPDLIYLHDTNQRELFDEANRLISSGCIRLEKPMEVAEYLLRGTAWDKEAILNTVAKPEDPPGKSTKIKLRKPIPVYMVFLTSQTSGDGVLRFTYDTYGHNDLILKKLGAAF